MRTNWHREALSLLEKESELDLRHMLFEFAKVAPKLFCGAVNPERYKWQTKAIALVNGGSRIEAIKHCRNATGMTLKNAKDAVDALCPNTT